MFAANLLFGHFFVKKRNAANHIIHYLFKAGQLDASGLTSRRLRAERVRTECLQKDENGKKGKTDGKKLPSGDHVRQGNAQAQAEGIDKEILPLKLNIHRSVYQHAVEIIAGALGCTCGIMWDDNFIAFRLEAEP